MKKHLILTSVLILAACGGGSGSRHSDVIGDNRGTPDNSERYLIVNAETRESNAQITSLESEIDICSNCTSPRPNSSRSATQTINNQTFTIYDLKDVDFVMADEGFDGKMQFDINADKQITGVTILGDPEDAEDNDKSFARQNDNSFTGPVTIGGGQHVNGKLTYNSVANAKRESLGLRYADFGTVRVDFYNNESDEYEELQHFVFIGGYDTAKRIDENTIDSQKTFTGYATGAVVAVRNGEDSGDELFLDPAPATLVLNNGTSTMTANFNKWYNVIHEKSANDESITFNNYTNDDDKFRMISDTTNNSFTLRNRQYQEYEENEPLFDEQHQPVKANTLNSDIRYYGDNGNPTESVGLIQIRDRGGNDANYVNINDYGDEHDPRPEVRMNLSFGVKSQQ